MRENYDAGHECWDAHDLTSTGSPTGAVRVSFGYMSTRGDANAVIRFLQSHFIDGNSAATAVRVPQLFAGRPKEPVELSRHHAQSRAAATWDVSSPQNQMRSGPAREDAWARGALVAGTIGADQQPCGAVLQGINIFPIKSCGAQMVDAWPLGPNGLLLDREWALIGPNGAALTQKEAPVLATICPRINLKEGVQASDPPHWEAQGTRCKSGSQSTLCGARWYLAVTLCKASL